LEIKVPQTVINCVKLFAELNNFIKKRTTAKSRDLTPAFRNEKRSYP